MNKAFCIAVSMASTYIRKYKKSKLIDRKNILKNIIVFCQKNSEKRKPINILYLKSSNNQ